MLSLPQSPDLCLPVTYFALASTIRKNQGTNKLQFSPGGNSSEVTPFKNELTSIHKQGL